MFVDNVPHLLPYTGLMRNDSINKRFSFKILSSVISAAMSLLTVSLMTRALGPVLLGKFDFLRAQFNSIVSFLNNGSAKAFYNYNSRHDQHQKSHGAIVFYRIFVGVVSLLVILGTWLSIAMHWNDAFWPEISEARYLLLGAFVALATWIYTVVTGFGDSKGQTLQVEIIKVASRAVGVVVLVVLFALNQITLTTYLIYTIAVMLLPTVISILYYRRAKLTGESQPLQTGELKSVGKYFYAFCSPLVVYSIFSLVHDIFDRWFLQFAAGSQQQGYYSLSLRFATICTLVIIAINPIFMRELSKSHGEKRLGVMRTLFDQYLRMIYFIVAGMAIFLAFHSNEIIYIFGGEKYRDASWPFFLMALYPLSAVYGQLNSSVYFSTERTGTYRNVLLVLMVVGLPISYALLAPSNYLIPGLQLGAMGLSIKKLVVQFIAVNTLAFFNCRYLGTSFRKLLFHQMVMIGMFAGVLWVFKGGRVLSTDTAGWWPLVRMAMTGIAYSFFVLMVIYCRPALAGLSRDEVIRLRNKLPFFRKQN